MANVTRKNFNKNGTYSVLQPVAYFQLRKDEQNWGFLGYNENSVTPKIIQEIMVYHLTTKGNRSIPVQLRESEFNEFIQKYATGSVLRKQIR